MNNLKSLENWNIEIAEGEIVLRKQSESYKTNVPELTITMDDGLGFTIEVFNYFIIFSSGIQIIMQKYEECDCIKCIKTHI